MLANWEHFFPQNLRALPRVRQGGAKVPPHPPPLPCIRPVNVAKYLK